MVSNGPPFFRFSKGPGEGAGAQDGLQKGNGHFAARNIGASSLPREKHQPGDIRFLGQRSAKQSRPTKPHRPAPASKFSFAGAAACRPTAIST